MMKQSRLKLLVISTFMFLSTLGLDLLLTLGQSQPGAPAVIDWSPNGTMIAGACQGVATPSLVPNKTRESESDNRLLVSDQRAHHAVDHDCKSVSIAG